MTGESSWNRKLDLLRGGMFVLFTTRFFCALSARLAIRFVVPQVEFDTCNIPPVHFDKQVAAIPNTQSTPACARITSNG